jgi:hypothetical protein
MPNQLAERATALWQEAQNPLELDQDWIAKQVNQSAQGEAEKIANLVQRTAGQLAEALDAAAKILSTGEREDRSTLRDFVKEMPAADFASPAIRLTRRGLLSVSAGLARRSVQHQLKARLGNSLVGFFNSYGRVLELWARGTIDSLAREFETHADIYRAQLQRLTAGTGSQEGIPREALLQSIASLHKHLQTEQFPEEVGSRRPI